MRDVIKRLIRFRIFSVPYRVAIFWNYIGPKLKRAIHWSFSRTEYSNFYYDLSQKNKLELAQLVSLVTQTPVDQISLYLSELSNDKALRDHMIQAFALDKSMKDSTLEFGRRLGWYAFVRAIKPKLVIETGVHQGVGSLVLTSALIQNELEGYPGKYIGTDIDTNAGELLKGIYSIYGTVMYGDSIETLGKLTEPIDLFINDSDHSAEYEAQEYETIKSKLSPNAVILGDNSHSSTSLLEFSNQNSRRFLLFREEPVNHWYPGAGIGVSFIPGPVS